LFKLYKVALGLTHRIILSVDR